jgi:hypothetical protein
MDLNFSLEVVFVVMHAGWHGVQLFPVCAARIRNVRHLEWQSDAAKCYLTLLPNLQSALCVTAEATGITVRMHSDPFCSLPWEDRC